MRARAGSLRSAPSGRPPGGRSRYLARRTSLGVRSTRNGEGGGRAAAAGVALPTSYAARTARPPSDPLARSLAGKRKWLFCKRRKTAPVAQFAALRRTAQHRCRKMSEAMYPGPDHLVGRHLTACWRLRIQGGYPLRAGEQVKAPLVVHLQRAPAAAGDAGQGIVGHVH